MTKLGADVTFFSEMEQSVAYRVLKKISKKLKKRFEKNHINKLLLESKKKTFDAVMVIRGGYFTPNIIAELKDNTKSATFYMYQWDSYRQNDYRDILPFFDVVSTFDYDDAEELNLSYQPLFYTDTYQKISTSEEKKIYDLVFYGAYHSDRLLIVKYFHQLFRDNDLIFKSHLFIKKIPLLFKLLKGEIKFKDLKFFKTYMVSPEEISGIYKKSEAVLDIELSIQSGLSMRTFEVLGSGVKLVTTNSNILNEDFYNSTQIKVINRSDINIDLAFFSSETDKIDLAKYHLDVWIERIFALADKN
jgi:hypothetical protein